MTFGLVLLAATLSLDGSWAFRFEEGKSIEEVAKPDFEATDAMAVPGCYDMMPKWYHLRGTGLYRRSFTLDQAVDNAWLDVDGIGLRGKFMIDGRDLGVHPYPYARLELETGPLAAGEHTVFAALDNRLDWKTMKLAQPFYDFYFYGGIYRGLSLKTDNRRIFVRTRDYATGTVEIKAVNFPQKDFDATLVFDSQSEMKVTFKAGQATVRVPDFKLWSPEHPNLHIVKLSVSSGSGKDSSSPLSARFGIRTVEARDRRIFLNGKPIFLKGVNRHEQCQEFGATTTESQMVRDLQILKGMNANFIRGAHYQQDQRFLDLCDEYGMLVWEESLGWQNGRWGKPDDIVDPEFIAGQVEETRQMVRNSFNHPSVIIFGFLNECASNRRECKDLVDKLVRAIRKEDSGRLVTFACDNWKTDICNENTDIISVNAYPGTIPMEPGSPAELREKVKARFDAAAERFRKLYPDKPIMVSESGCGAFYGWHDPLAANGSEEFQDEYLTDILEAIWSNPDYVGFAIWQFANTNTHHRNNPRASHSGRMLGISISGIMDFQRNPKKAVETVRKFFGRR